MYSASSSSSEPRKQLDLRAALQVGPQRLLLAVLVVGDDRRRRVEDHLGRSVVLLEPDDLRIGEVGLEVHDVAQVGAAPLVDRLIGVADDGEVAMLAGDLLDQQVLRPVGVLVFVHHHVVELVRVALADRGVLVEQLDGREQQVVEIERARVLQRLDVALEQLADLASFGFQVLAKLSGPSMRFFACADAARAPSAAGTSRRRGDSP